MQLPNKNKILTWECESVIQKLMSENRWSRKIATQWFQDFMCWLYAAMSWNQLHGTEFIMDGLHYLDDVWHTYILHTQEYFKMCNELFKIDYIHHKPAHAFNQNKIEKKVYRQQLLHLLNNWGEEYIDRVWAYGADLADLATTEQPNFAV